MHNSIIKNEYVFFGRFRVLLVSDGGMYILSYLLHAQILECS